MKRRIIAAVMAIGCAVSLWFGTGINGRAMTDLDVSKVVSKHIREPEDRNLQDMNISINEQEWMILYYTNGIRMVNGLQPLSTFGALQSACDVRANELGTLFDHTRPNGSDCYSVLGEMGISYMSAAENIAAGMTDPWDTINDWWNSPGHQRNMLSDNDHMGVGYQYHPYTTYGHYWVQLFTGGCTTQSISIVDDQNYIYLLPAGGSIDNLGLIVEARCEHGSSYLPLMDGMCSGYDPNASDQIQTVTVQYNGCSTQIQIYSYPPMQFSDVNYSTWYYGYVEYVYALGLMTGLNDTYFGAVDPLARAQFATILYRINGEPEVEYSPEFADVLEGEWYTDPIIWASEQGVVTGYSNGNFGPGDYINREQMAVMMYRYAQSKGYDTSSRADFSGFSDGAYVSDFAVEAMQWAVGTGIISGKDRETRLDPQGNANRAECATIITRFVSTYGG